MAPLPQGLATSLSQSGQEGGQHCPTSLRPLGALRPPSMGMLPGPSWGVHCVLHPFAEQALWGTVGWLPQLLQQLRLAREAWPQAFLLKLHHQLPRWPSPCPQGPLGRGHMAPLGQAACMPPSTRALRRTPLTIRASIRTSDAGSASSPWPAATCPRAPMRKLSPAFSCK